ncbi:class I tRNA ligase family protein, partial [Candidatus Dojkabacteria bacterium]|nr:class I tRNA ligase family protein [Candidatus Dojkabacteria bacterium]
NNMGSYEVMIENEKVDDYVALVKKYLKEGYWCEVVSLEDRFIFPDEEIVLSSSTAKSIMDKCKAMEPSVKDISNVYSMIISNDFYATDYVFEDEGRMINSEFLDGLTPKDAIGKMVDYLEKKGYGKKTVSYNLRDWCVSRQRYWGAPIPMIYCDECGWQTVEETDLPVLLPDISNFNDILPDGSGKPPLAKDNDFVNVKCPNCDKDAKRETDVLDAFVDSCWYFLRYPCTEFDNEPFSTERMRKWLPVDKCIGGKEHTVLHLLYARFITMVLHDQGMLEFEEPFKVFFGHGLITKDGAKMSKSKGNIINPDEWVEKVGADTMRMYFRFMGDFSQGGDWRDNGIIGMHKFVKRIWRINTELVKYEKDDSRVIKKYHQMLKKVTEDIEALSFNTAVAMIMEFINTVVETGYISKELWMEFIKVLAPFMPFISEELWELNGGDYSVHAQAWPIYDESKIQNDNVTIAVQVNGKLRTTVEVAFNSSEEFVVKEAMKSEKVQAHLSGEYKKAVFVKNRILNFIV